MFGRHRSAAAGAAGCWQCGTGSGSLCTAHERAVRAAVERDARTVARGAVEVFGDYGPGFDWPDMDRIDRNRGGSATPGLDEGQRSAS